MTETADIVIVGAGPTGLTAAYLCRRLGLSAIVLERRDGSQRSPAAHVVNARSFEIWRQAGVDMDVVLADAFLPPVEAGHVRWVTRLGGEVVGTLPFEQQGDDMLGVTPTPLRNLSQHRLEPVLAGGLDLRYSHTWKATTEHAAGVIVDVDGPGGTYRVGTKYVLAADGAASSVRRSLGIEMDGPRTIESFVMVHLAADFRALVGEATGVLYFLVDPVHGGTFVSHGADREWVYMHGWDPEAESIDVFTDERCHELVQGAIADPGVEFEVLGASTWHMSAQIAPRYRVGRTFLVGDAAHRFPPTGGLGLNSGVADAHNLIWKLAAVEAGWAPASALDTYEAERRPVAQFNCDQSLRNAMKLAEVPVAFGFAEPRARTVEGMHAALADPTRRASIEAAIANQAIHFDLLGLQLGFSYDGPLVIDDGTEPVVLDEPARDYSPSTRPGGRLPHGWIDETTSTLDLVDPVVPTVLRRRGEVVDVPPNVAMVDCPPEIWDTTFDLGGGEAIVVRPDQHVAYRGPSSGVAAALTRLFGQAHEA